ncbi:MAG TPA: hypothetical protein VGH80_00630 [Xanthomonadaceae bacterium]|jgi:uncharacterized membrane protein
MGYIMSLQKKLFVALVIVAAVALWLLLAGPVNIVGIDTGQAGMALLVSVAWIAVYAVARMPAGGIEKTISPGEWKAWTGLGFAAVVGAYALAHAQVFDGPSMWHNPDANRVGRNIAMLVIAWAVLSQVLQRRWKDGVQRDERDRDIATRASGWARGTLSGYAIGLAVLLGFTPAERLAWAPPPMIAQMLVLGLILSCLVEYAVTAVSYWRDRH